MKGVADKGTLTNGMEDEFNSQPTQMWKGGEISKVSPNKKPATTNAGQPQAILLMVKGQEVFRLPLKKQKNVIGRALDCDVKLDLLSISRRHAQISLGPPHSIEDLGSSSGSLLNDARLTQKKTLADHDVIKLGDQAFHFVELGAIGPDDFPIFYPQKGGAPVELHGQVCTVGRANANLVVADTRVSTKHAIVEIFSHNSVYLIDLASRNGTTLNGVAVTQPTLLQNNDVVAFAGIEYRVVLGRDQRTMMGVVPTAMQGEAQSRSLQTSTLRQEDLEPAASELSGVMNTRTEAIAMSDDPSAAARLPSSIAAAAAPSGISLGGKAKWWTKNAVVRMRSGDRPFTIKVVGGTIFVAGLFYPYPLVVTGECRLTAGTVQKVRSSVSGQIERVQVSDGQEVKKGDLLISIAARELTADKKQAEITLEQVKLELNRMLRGATKENVSIAQERLHGAQTQASFAKKTLDRNQQLAKEGIISREALQNAQENYASALQSVREAQKQLELVTAKPMEEQISVQKAEVEKAEREVQIIAQQLNETQLKAEIDGKIATANVKALENRFVAPGQEIIEVQNTSEMVLEILVPESEIGDVSDNQPVRARIRTNPGHIYETVVEKITPVAEVGPLGSMVVVKARLKNDAADLIPGTSGTAKITGKRHLIISQVLRRILRVFKLDTF